ncbi:methyl-accepting chemotaxis protein [Alteromonas gilva]|uniref:Methyl-accepting chemotaxis protein n=1 Tax=Alteromonas gilva TaxID=2987522 RepID=A0ABT5L7L7_9ALTE|nr:methyl-accepting chemotaxis protein [Alteromonas gilva]MDC8831817.1 methyl-accepting chemotaxis protein [Alteromonas gilva]
MKIVISQLVSIVIVSAVLALFDVSWAMVSVVIGFCSCLVTYYACSAFANGEESSSQSVGFTEFNQRAERISQSASRVAIGGANVSYFLDKLAGMFKQQVASVEDIANQIKHIESGNLELIEHAGQAEEEIRTSDDMTQRSRKLLADILRQQENLIQQISDSKSMLESLRSSAESIGSITTTINQLADQTNMLALNAAIEAARAGDQGRGFAVVADEVRDLAKKTTDATQGIDAVLNEINTYSQNSVQAIERVSAAGEEMSQMINESSNLIKSASEASSIAASSMAVMKDTVDMHGEANLGIGANTSDLNDNTKYLEHELSDVSEKVLSLSHQTEDIFRQLQVFELDNRNAHVQRIAQDAASRIGQLFENAIRDGGISEQQLFDFQYKPVPNTNPQKFTTQFDQFTDKQLPGIQEPILQENSFIVYAGAVDKNGYFPTHNKKFSHAMTGDYDVDLAKSRTKRIFDDYTGSRCGKNTESFLLQTYKRDTGEVMHDLSAPIFVNNRHWGGFRIGYQAE